MARGKGRGLAGLSFADIQKELRRRERRIRTLERRRATLARRLSALDSQITELGGRAMGRSTGRTRPQNDSNLVDSLRALLKGKTMGVTEMTGAVQKAGYRTHAENFRTIVNQTLIKHKKFFKRVARGQYTAN